MIPPEEGVWGKRGSPIRRFCPQDLSSLNEGLWFFGDAPASVEWADFVSASNLVYVRGRLFFARTAPDDLCVG